ncbi:MAG: leucine-rich repeat domain-containing protein [Bacteroidales bacterium]|nr:leucine-rich repeat domain-containing protein [Bacteroidales bacterium]
MSKVVLTEEIEFADFEKYEKLVAQPDVTEIDISQFSIKDCSYEEFEEKFEIYEDGDRYYELDDSVRPLSLLAKLVLNKEFATSFVIENGFVYSLDKRVLVCCQTNRGLVAPYDVEIIGHYAFCNKHIYSVSFPQTLKLIGNHAFEDNDELEEVVLPNSVTHLGECCFYSCGIEDLKLSNNLEYIPGCCFCFNELKDVDIPASVKKIDASAFSGNLIRRVVLPEGVESIESDALSTPEYVWLPSTIRWIDKEFFCETPIVDPEDCIPYIDVDERNPLFFSKDGTLYKRDNPKEPYLGYPYSGYKWDGKMDDV